GDVMKYKGEIPLNVKMDFINVQKMLSEYASSTGMVQYIDRLMIFNESGHIIQAVVKDTGSITDNTDVLLTRAYKERKTAAPFSILEPSLTPHRDDCFTYVLPISELAYYNIHAYVYIEVSKDIVLEVLKPYARNNGIFVSVDGSDTLISLNKAQNQLIPQNTNDIKLGETFEQDGNSYKLDAQKVPGTSLTIYNVTDMSALTLNNRKMFYTLIVVLASVLVVSLGILVISTNFITRPLQKLIERIKRMSQNDFSFDPEIEKTPDEIGDVGKVINEMCLSFNNLLHETTEASEAKKNIEIDLLQSQVNPHFLYNTLDSIHWMAVIQKNPGICNITRSLSNLLKNMAKGFSQKIPLSEELKLLDDYVTIQSIRYMETFELVNNIDKKYYDYNIVKLTLQPIVENAIFHGIEPSGVYGTITLTAHEDDKYLIISVEDSGIGMTPEEISTVMTASKARARTSMSGIGVGNVNNRLHLVYGAGCGLTIESVKGEFTRINIRILKEKGEVTSNVQNTISR
ncbi:MAG: histidine kinase, partial [Oscillospiraceae bacterium]